MKHEIVIYLLSVIILNIFYKNKKNYET